MNNKKVKKFSAKWWSNDLESTLSFLKKKKSHYGMLLSKNISKEFNDDYVFDITCTYDTYIINYSIRVTKEKIKNL